ncbi:MAG: hypothetical protein S4CHLAM7_07710 [Chlamydiae bacterium]|nr:hypothetical protein [Chlamydiota bacterium]
MDFNPIGYPTQGYSFEMEEGSEEEGGFCSFAPIQTSPVSPGTLARKNTITPLPYRGRSSADALLAKRMREDSPLSDEEMTESSSNVNTYQRFCQEDLRTSPLRYLSTPKSDVSSPEVDRTSVTSSFRSPIAGNAFESLTLMEEEESMEVVEPTFQKVEGCVKDGRLSFENRGVVISGFNEYQSPKKILD